MLRLLDGIIDIYMPDMKFADPGNGLKFAKVPNYPALNQDAVLEMHRQVKDLQTDDNGIAKRGLLVRHLILPDNLASTDKIIEFIANQITPNTYLNLMDQYRPAYRSNQIAGLNRRITEDEYSRAIRWAFEAGLNRLDKS